ncbi:MAG: DUF427 domain-containing protein [Acidobacteriota bacterium]|nr:DUF427 domain-containing protein [Acidobacteriota bacterium]
MEAVWNGAVLARSENTVVIEGNHYFPPEAINREFFTDSPKHTVCPWKGQASYYDVVVGGERNPAAAWYYPQPSPAAAKIRDHVAFWHGVRVRQAPE